MGISQIGVAAATASPSSASRPIFTLANTYNLSTPLSGVGNVGNMINDMVYLRSSGKIGFATESTTTTNAWCVWTPGTTTVAKYNLPISIQNEKFKFTVGGAGRLWYLASMDDDTTRNIYYSTNDGSTWTNYASITTGANDIFPLSTSLKPDYNTTDELEIGVYGQSTKQFYNLSSGAYTYTFGYTDTIAQSSGTFNKIIPVRSGDDSGIINGYHHRFGSTYNDSNGYRGITGTSIFSLYDSRDVGKMLFLKAEPEHLSTYSKDGYQDQPSGRATCIENRWIHFSGRTSFGGMMYDMQTQKFMGGIDVGYYGPSSSRIVYLSSTKKAYLYSGLTKKMYEYDVTFI